VYVSVFFDHIDKLLTTSTEEQIVGYVAWVSYDLMLSYHPF